MSFCSLGQKSQQCFVSPADIDECAEEVLTCPGVNVFCVNTEGSFHCQCAAGYTRREDTCERSQTTGELKHHLSFIITEMK